MKSILSLAAVAVLFGSCSLGRAEEPADQPLRFWLLIGGDGARLTATEPIDNKDGSSTRIFRIQCREMRAAPAKDGNLAWTCIDAIATCSKGGKTCRMSAPRIVIANDPSQKKGMHLALEGDDLHPIQMSSPGTLVTATHIVLYPAGMTNTPSQE